MNYFQKNLKELSDKAVLYNNHKIDITNEMAKKEFLYDFLHSLYCAFDLRKDYKISDGKSNQNVDYFICFLGNPVVIAKIIDIEKDLQKCTKEVEAIFRKQASLVYFILTDGIKYMVFKNSEGVAMEYHLFDIAHLKEKDMDKYFDMRWMNIVYHLEEHMGNHLF